MLNDRGDVYKYKNKVKYYKTGRQSNDQESGRTCET